ncbi:MAG: hemin uptake protein HemP [Reyranella sp.]|uniref:hemin uptake protein HemP n=1 Tax=Reyranella sp. TaxID=1929291 RepID=UPI003D0D42B1
MSQPPRQARPDGNGGETISDLPVQVVDSTALMCGNRELLIRHGADIYRLRVTASNKLILTK